MTQGLESNDARSGSELRLHCGVTMVVLSPTELGTFFVNSADLLAVLDDQLCVLQHNAAFARQLGVPAPHTSLVELVAPRDREKVRAALTQAFHGATRSFDASVVRPNQTVRACEWTVGSGQGHLFVTIRDVTPRRRLEKELAQAQKLEAVGQLASGIAHEINTPIQYVGDNLTFIGDALKGLLASLHSVRELAPVAKAFEHVDVDFLSKELPAAVEQAQEGVQRVAELVRGMKEFAHQDRGEVAPTDLNRAIERTLTVSRNEWKYAAEVSTHLSADLPLVPCQGSAIRQVLLNLICNAGYAIAEQNKRIGRKKGVLRLATRREGAWAVVVVSDDGGGIPELVRARLFEPFFTTKPVGKGTGQGLAISRSIVCDKHGGTLTYETELGVGTSFTVRLPLAAAHVGSSEDLPARQSAERDDAT